MLESAQWAQAAAYVGGSVLAGLAAVALGYLVSR